MPIKPGKSISPTSVTLIGCQSDMPLERLRPRSSSPMSSPVKWYRDSRESDFSHSSQQSSHQHSHWQASKPLYWKVLYQSLRCDCGTLLNSLWWSFCCYIGFCCSYTAMVCQENKGSSQLTTAKNIPHQTQLAWVSLVNYHEGCCITWARRNEMFCPKQLYYLLLHK